MDTALADPADSEGPTLASYLGWLRRRWWILLLTALLGTGAGLLITQLQNRSYVSSTRILVRQVGLEANPNTKVNLDTEAQLVGSLLVAERARSLMSSDLPPEKLLRSIAVTVPPNSQVLKIAFQAGTPRAAQAGSHAFARAYLDQRMATARRALQAEQDLLDRQIAEANKQMQVVAGRIANSEPDSVTRERAEADRNVLTQQLGTLNSRLTRLLTASHDPGEIISDAPLPGVPSSPNRRLNLAGGLGAGLIFGILLALLLDRLDTRVRRGRDINDRLGLRTLLELREQAHALAILPAPHRISRELGRLRNVLLTTVPEARVPGGGRQLLITGASAGPAAGFVAGNLAAAYARTGAQVAVVTTKPDSPLRTMVGGGRGARHGLSHVLRRDVTALKALTPVPDLSHLRVLLPGDLEQDVELPIAVMLEVLAELAGRFDHVLIETASPTLAVEAQALASHVDAVIVVAETGRTRRREIAAALRQFEQVGAPVLGAVLAPLMRVRGTDPANDQPALAGQATGQAAVPDRPAATGVAPAPRHDDHPGASKQQSPVAKRQPEPAPHQPAEPTIVLPRMPAPQLGSPRGSQRGTQPYGRDAG